jgi:hypothetical protein
MQDQHRYAAPGPSSHLNTDLLLQNLITVNKMKFPDAVIKTVISVVILKQFYLHEYITCLDCCQLVVTIWTKGEKKLISFNKKQEGGKL